MKWNAVRPPRCRGFTLVEMLAVVALLAVIAVMGTPSFVAWYVRDQVDARARVLASTLAYARSEALRQGARVTVCRTDTARHCLAAGQPCGNGVADWSCGWAVLAERDGTLPLLRYCAIARAAFARGREQALSSWRAEATCVDLE